MGRGREFIAADQPPPPLSFTCLKTPLKKAERAQAPLGMPMGGPRPPPGWSGEPRVPSRLDLVAAIPPDNTALLE